MKNFFTLLALCYFSFQLSAQITIERSDYLREIGSTVIHNELDLTTVRSTPPSEGLNQIWDYSNVTVATMDTVVIEAGTHPDLPTANIVGRTMSFFLGLIPQTFTFYSALNDDSYTTVGRLSSGASANLAALTGNDTDTLTLTGGLDIYEDPSYFYQFPISYGDTYDSDLTLNSNYILTLAAFGLDHVPGNRRISVSNTHEISGSGILILPNSDGSANVGLEALLIKHENVQVDSIFLGGQPAPETLLAAFGLVQGAVTTNTTYTFAAKGLFRSALFISESGGVITEASIAHDIESVGTPLNDLYTIEREDYTRTIGETIANVSLNPEELFIPTEGLEEQVWDYGNLTIAAPTSFTVTAGTHPDLPTANIITTSNEVFLGLIPRDFIFYESLNTDFYGTIGQAATGGSTSLAPITGSDSDTLNILPSFNAYENPSYYYQFPIALGDAATTPYSVSTGYNLTVAAFGLDHVPGLFKTDISHLETVNGYGTLILPHPDGIGTVSIEALLRKDIETRVDSIFLGGAPAPDALLGAFGLVQGAVSTQTTYSFVTKGLSRSAFTFSVSDGEYSSILMADALRDFSTSTQKIAPDLLSIETFPNPSNGNFTIAFDKIDGTPWTFKLYNLLGQQILQESLDFPVGKTTFTPNTSSLKEVGTYFYTLQNGTGQIIGLEKVIVE